MLKIIETNLSVDEELIGQYLPAEYETYQMYLQENKYTIESISDYQNVFSLGKLDKMAGMAGIITNGELLSEYHQNKLLKLFEDSNDQQLHLLFIDRSDRLLDTVRSRGLILRDPTTFKYEDNELHNFGRKIVSSNAHYQLLLDNDPIFRVLYKIDANLNAPNINQGIININSVKLTADTYNLFTNLVYNHLYKTKRNDLLAELFEIELRSKYQVNYNLQAIGMLITIKGNKEYYERSDWSQKHNN